MKAYLKNFLNQTPQSQAIPNTAQVPNSAGGYSWELDMWGRLRRFLILGSEGGTYYINQHQLTVENANAVIATIQADGLRAVYEIVTLSTTGRAPKNDPAIFALALAASVGDDATRKAALDALPKVCRIGTHLFSFAEYIKGMRGWGRGLRRGVGAWYLNMDERKLAYQAVKYRQRNGWTHRDVLRLAHPIPVNEVQTALFQWVTHRNDDEPLDTLSWSNAEAVPEHDSMAFIWAFEQVQNAETVDEILRLVADYDLPREALPTQWLTDVNVWDALLVKMPMTAMLRNLATMTKIGLLEVGNEATNAVVERLKDAGRLRKARIHPISVLSALRVYAGGHSLRGGQQDWTPIPQIVDTLDTAFELAFMNVEPTNKRMMLALDVSGSMQGGFVAGVTGLTPRDASAAMAMVTARTEPNYMFTGFSTAMIPLNISAKMRLDTVIKTVSGLPFGGTDCAQPMLYALKNKLKIDTFMVYTDSETWHGNIHPAQALRQYRDKTGIDAKLIVVGMVSNGFSIADPNDKGMLDVVGFDSATPNIMADFSRGMI
jgi:60 kDa SS-A/Ro ribonucleoprotein